MTSLWRSGRPFDDQPPGNRDDEYAMWDAAYVLGSLSSAERREFETHMGGCVSCRQAVNELSGMPALLSQLDRDQVASIAEDDEFDEASLPPDLLPSLLAKVARRRRRSRLMTWTATAAAAAVLVIGVFIGVKDHSLTGLSTLSTPPQASASVLPMAQVGTAALASTVSVNSQHWGTYIDLKCVCLAPVNSHHDTLAMVVVRRDGSHTRLATWVAEPGHTATPAGSIATPVDQIAAVQVVLAENDRVLLERSL
jgi:anti-sigma factor RsiW